MTRLVRKLECRICGYNFYQNVNNVEKLGFIQKMRLFTERITNANAIRGHCPVCKCIVGLKEKCVIAKKERKVEKR